MKLNIIPLQTKCKAVEWIEENVTISNPLIRNIPFKMYPHQIDYINWLENSTETNKFMQVERQQGYTTTSLAYSLYRMYQTRDTMIYFVNSNNKQSVSNADMFREMRKRLPEKYQKFIPEIDYKQQCSVRTSIIRFASAEPRNACGQTANLVFLEDYEFYKNPIEIINITNCMLSSEKSKIVGYSYPNNNPI